MRAQVTVAPTVAAPPVSQRAWDALCRAPAGRLAAGIVLLGGLLRLYRVDALSLWVDEGLTVTFARLPWHILLGFGPTYSPHPPLYFALVKLASSILPARIAGRLLSVAAGTFTIATLYALGARLATPRVGLAAALVLALSPLHVWYSQEARPYALVVLLVALSYLALAAIYRGGGRAWLLAYGLALAGALYAEYSAVFALTPQAALLLYAIARRRRRAWATAGTALAAALAFVPWLPHLAASAGPTSAQPQFALSAAKVAGSLLSVAGLTANQAVFDGDVVPPWLLWPGGHAVLILAVAPAAILGGARLARRAPPALLVALALGAGTIACAVAIGLRYPSYVERTVLSATLGWALLLGGIAAGAPPSEAREPSESTGMGRLFTSPAPSPRTLTFAIARAGRLALAATLALSALTLGTLYDDAYKQEWSALAADTAAAARLGWPVVTYPAVAATLIDVYQPRALDRAGVAHVALADLEGLPAGVRALADRAGAVWLAYDAGTGSDRLGTQLAAWGYRRLVHAYYPYPLYLDLYVRPGARLGAIVPIGGRRPGQAEDPAGWHLPPGASLSGGGTSLTMTNGTPGELAASVDVPAAPGHLYTLDIEARARLATGAARGYLICLAAGGVFRAVAPDDGGAVVADDGRWHEVTIGALCPAGTTSVRIDLRNGGRGTVDMRGITLRERRPAAR